MLPLRARRTVSIAFLLLGSLTLVAALVALQGDFPRLLSRSATATLVASIAVLLLSAGFRLARPARSPGVRTGRIVLFEALLDVGDSPVTPALTIRGPRDAIERFIPLAEFPGLFGGYVIWEPSAEPTPELPGEALGVWSRRTCSRFGRVLRERGAEVEVRRERGPAQKLGRWNKSYAR